jgi:hypothetical protein
MSGVRFSLGVRNANDKSMRLGDGEGDHLRSLYRRVTRNTRRLARTVHENYFHPVHEEFQGRTMWSLSNAFTSAFLGLGRSAAVRGGCQLGPFLEGKGAR